MTATKIYNKLKICHKIMLAYNKCHNCNQSLKLMPHKYFIDKKCFNYVLAQKNLANIQLKLSKYATNSIQLQTHKYATNAIKSHTIKKLNQLHDMCHKKIIKIQWCRKTGKKGKREHKGKWVNRVGQENKVRI